MGMLLDCDVASALLCSRYVATSVTSVHHEMENGFNIWSFNGKLLYRILKDHFFQVGASILSFCNSILSLFVCVLFQYFKLLIAESAAHKLKPVLPYIIER